mmetsp:Transcript_28021/g.65801  ORF Transcript_28021/g.65801 Transcript_28021/m.65801 type:complete len:263 (-) Transcript_28021:14-802(-)
MVNTTNMSFVQGMRFSSGATLCHSWLFMNANRVNMESAIVLNMSRVSSGMSCMELRSSPLPIARVVRIARAYSATKVKTSTQNMLCMARTTPMASMYSGRMARTTRTSRRILIRRRSRASVINLLRPPPLWLLCVMKLHALSTQSSMTPAATMVMSKMFQPPSSELVKNSQPRCLTRRTASSTKKESIICSAHSHIGDWMSVSSPMITAFKRITTPTADWNVADSTQEKSAVKSTRSSLTTRMNRASRATRRSGLKTLRAMS